MATSRPSRGRRRAGGAALLGLLLGCGTPSAPPLGSPLEPLASAATPVPDDSDRVARDLAAAALAGPRPAALAELARLEALEEERGAGGEPPSGLVPVARDLANATLDDPIAYRAAARELLERDDLDEGLRRRLEQDVADDPLQLADRRLRDARVASFAKVFNAVAAPLGRSVTAGVRSAWSLFHSLVGLAVSEHLEDELDFRGRQALALWKRFLDVHPDSPLAPRVAERVEDTQQRWHRTRRDRALRSARRALDEQRPQAALVLSERALRYAPEDREATQLRDEAEARLLRLEADRRRALHADAPLELREEPEAARALAVALLVPGGAVAEAAHSLGEAATRGPLSDEADFASALAVRESGAPRAESQGFSDFGKLAGRDPRRSNMARHAAALAGSPLENPYAAFRKARSRDRRQRVGWIFLGPLAGGARDFDLPRPVEWLIDFPKFFEAFLSFPNRVIGYARLRPWPFGRAPARHGRRYLERYPGGEHRREVASWLEGFERRRGNWVGAYRLAEGLEPDDPRRLAKLREKAAGQALEAARREPRRDVRNAMLRGVARDYQGSRAGQQAGELARRELEEATAQRIRISRGFLEENPRVAGPDGLALRPELLDRELGNGELHPEGVLLTGGRTLEFRFIGPDGDKDSPPVVEREQVSAERLARIAAQLEETALRNALRDPDDVFAPDPDRDLYLERARLGVADEPDRRATAQSTYAFVGMRERYGLVRGRESILPVELVVQGSLPDFGIGVFPRVKTPKPTPDAFLYR